MKTILALMRKEFLQVFRNPQMVRMLFVMPLLQLFLLGYVASTKVKLINTAIYDFDRSELSREYIKALTADDYFVSKTPKRSIMESETGLKENEYNAILAIPNDFSERISRFETVNVGFIVDGSNANSASIALGYASLITAQFNKRITGFNPPITIREKRLYNPEGESIYFMVPGIVAVLLTMITMMLTAMAIVREREIGTLEQLMVTPISTPALILGKTLPFALIGFVELSFALFVGMTWFGVPFAGSWGLLYGISMLYLFSSLGIGMFISTMSRTQQQAMFFSWFFSLFTMLTSGFFTPVANMPKTIQYLTYLNPLRFFMSIVRSIIMKGAGLSELYPQVLAIMIFGTVVFCFSWIRFSKRIK